MSIYNKGFNFKFSIGKAKEAAIVILVILFVVLAVYAVSNAFAQSPLEIRFEQNPWIQSEKESIILFVKAANITGIDAKEAILEVKPKAENSLIIFPQTARLSETLAPNDSRVLTFNIRKALPSEALKPGKYTLELKVSFDGKEFNSETVLEVK
jgi:hypothetical protein